MSLDHRRLTDMSGRTFPEARREVNPLLKLFAFAQAHTAAAAAELRRREEGQTMAEYSVVLAVITVATVAVFPAFGAAALGVVTRVTGLLP